MAERRALRGEARPRPSPAASLRAAPGESNCQRPPPSSSDPGTNSPSASQSGVARRPHRLRLGPDEAEAAVAFELAAMARSRPARNRPRASADQRAASVRHRRRGALRDVGGDRVVVRRAARSYRSSRSNKSPTRGGQRRAARPSPARPRRGTWPDARSRASRPARRVGRSARARRRDRSRCAGRSPGRRVSHAQRIASAISSASIRALVNSAAAPSRCALVSRIALSRSKPRICPAARRRRDRQIEQQPLEIGADLDVHRRRCGRRHRCPPNSRRPTARGAGCR